MPSRPRRAKPGPPVTKALSATIVGGSQSGTWSRAIASSRRVRLGSTISVKPLNASAAPIAPAAAAVASNCDAGERASVRTAARAAASHASRKRGASRSASSGVVVSGCRMASTALALFVVLRSRVGAEMDRDRAPGGNRCDQSADAGLEDAGPVAKVAGFAERRVDQRIERDHPTHPSRAGPRAPSAREARPVETARARPESVAAAIEAHSTPNRRRAAPRSVSARTTPGAHDPQRNLDHPRDGQGDHRFQSIRPAARAEHVAGDDRGGEAGEARAVGGEVLPATRRRNRRPRSKARVRLGSRRGPVGRGRRSRLIASSARRRPDQAERAFAQRCPELRLTDQRGGRAGPGGASSRSAKAM